MKMPVRVPFDISSRLRFNAAESAGVPSWKTIPGRKVKIHWVKSSLELKLSSR